MSGGGDGPSAQELTTQEQAAEEAQEHEVKAAQDQADDTTSRTLNIFAKAPSRPSSTRVESSDDLISSDDEEEVAGLDAQAKKAAKKRRKAKLNAKLEKMAEKLFKKKIKEE